MWAEGRRYFYRGELAGEANGGGLYELPSLVSYIDKLNIEPVDIKQMVQKNKPILNGWVQRTLNYIYETYKEYSGKRADIIYVAFSGGKDSIVLLDLVQRALPHDAFKVIFADTTMELPDTLDAVEMAKQRWNDLDWHIVKSHMDASETWEKIGPPARSIRWCCSVHKTVPSITFLREVAISQNSNLNNFKVLAFLGIRAEESDARASYGTISEGNKHKVQINCNPIIDWNSSELFLYMLESNLDFHKAYRYGFHRVGCLLCPMSSKLNESLISHLYPSEVSIFTNIIKSSILKSYNNEKKWDEFLSDGGWKQRSSGKILQNTENKIISITDGYKYTFILRNFNLDWHTWIRTIGDLNKISDELYELIYKDIKAIIVVNQTTEAIVLHLDLPKMKDSITFLCSFKNALNKSAYCIKCGVCAAECGSGAIELSKNEIVTSNCKHCTKCLNLEKGCVVARSKIITGGNKMKEKSIDTYKTFGLREVWLKIFLENPENFWVNKQMGSHMFFSFKSWGKQAGLLDAKNNIAPLTSILCNLTSSKNFLWAIIYINLSYSSPIFNWYLKNIKFHDKVTISDMILLLGDGFPETTKKNALSSLKETLKASPIGANLGQGECEMKGKNVVAVTRGVWQSPEPLAILYSLYKFAENSDMYYNFTLSDLLDDSEERIGLSPNILFGIDRTVLQPILQGLAHDYNDYIKVTFNKGLENINLNREKTSIDIVKLY